MLRDAGIDRHRIQAGFPDDGWVQIEDGGYIDDGRIQVPAGAYHPSGIALTYPRPYTDWFGELTPSVSAQFFILSEPLSCFAATNFPLVEYTRWLPPFHRALYVQQLKTAPE
jgi:hypothetical protein